MSTFPLFLIPPFPDFSRLFPPFPSFPLKKEAGRVGPGEPELIRSAPVRSDRQKNQHAHSAVWKRCDDLTDLDLEIEIEE